MKMKTKYQVLSFAALLLGALSFTGCSDDESYDVDGYDYNRIYFDKAQSVDEGSVVNTPVGTFASINGKIIVKSTGSVSETTQASVKVDTSLIATYNAVNGTSYKTMPDGVISFSKTELTIPAKATESADTATIAINKDVAAKAMTLGETYLAPVVISQVKGDGRPSSNAAVRYVAVKCVQSLINDDATGLSGTALDVNSFTCLSADGLDKDNYGFQGWSGWAFTKKQDKASFVVDFNETKNVVGFYVGGELIKSATVYLSEDNQKWTELGNTADHKAASETKDWSSVYEYVLYGAVPARYMKVEMTLDPDSWYWQYLEYGYATLNSFSVYAQ